MHLLTHPADDADRFAEVYLRVAGRRSQRHESLPRPRSRLAHILLHRCVAAAIAMRGLEALENTLRRMPLLRRRRHVGFKERVDDPDERPELGPEQRRLAHIAR